MLFTLKDENAFGPVSKPHDFTATKLTLNPTINNIIIINNTIQPVRVTQF